MSRRWSSIGIIAVAGLAMALVFAAPASAAYNHKGDNDSAFFREVHPEATGTKLDSCTLCHTGGSTTQGGKTVNLGSCQWCHEKYGYDAKGSILVTLNSYGAVYRLAGSNKAAVDWIDGIDSDRDGFTNAQEIRAVRFPGDPLDDPTKIPASYRIYTLGQIKAMTAKTQFLAMNASKSDDTYTQYTGVTMEDLLASARMLPSATGIKVYAPDGFSVYHPIDPPTSTVPGIYPVKWTYPAGTFYYNSIADMALNPTGGWINYSSPGCEGRATSSTIEVSGGLKLLLAYARDGAALSHGALNASNKLDGEGPFRVVPPQVAPGWLDQRSTNSSAALVWPYDSALDHNAGFSSRSATIIKVEPLPPGTTDFDVFEAGWDLLDQDKVVVYGALQAMPTSITINRSAASVLRGRTIVLSGALSLASPGDKCLVEMKPPGSRKWIAASTRVIGAPGANGAGAWAYRYTPRVGGTYWFRVRFRGDVTRTPCMSRTISVLVR